jgi:branched-chain amino acid transport system substrate-binding protein
MPYVNGGGAASEIYKRGYKYIFGVLSPVELLGTTLMTWIDEQQKAGKLPKPSTIAVVWENTSHGKDFRKGIQDFAAKSGGGYNIVVDESFELNGKDYSALLSKVKAAGRTCSSPMRTRRSSRCTGSTSTLGCATRS